MIFWATLGFGIAMLVAWFFFPRIAFLGALLAFLAKAGWLSFFRDKPSPVELGAELLVVAFSLVALIIGLAFDWKDLQNRLEEYL